MRFAEISVVLDREHVTETDLETDQFSQAATSVLFCTSPRYETLRVHCDMVTGHLLLCIVLLRHGMTASRTKSEQQPLPEGLCIVTTFLEST